MSPSTAAHLPAASTSSPCMRRSYRPGHFPSNRPQPVRFACGCRAQPECRYAGNDDEPGRRPDLDAQGPTRMRVRSMGQWLPSRWTKRRSANSIPYLGWSAPRRPGALRAMCGVVSGWTDAQGGWCHYIDRGGCSWDTPRGHLPHVTVIDASTSERPKTRDIAGRNPKAVRSAGFVGRTRYRLGNWSPPSAAHDLVERASVQPLDHGQRLVRRVPDGEQVGQETSLGDSQNGSGLVLVGTRRMAGADDQVGGGDGHRLRRLAQVVLQESRLSVVLLLWRDDGDRGGRAGDMLGALPDLRQLDQLRSVR